MVKGLDRYSLLDKAIRISNSSVDVERRLKNFLELFRREIEADHVSLFSLDRDAGLLLVRAVEGMAQAPELRFELMDNCIGQTALTRKTAIVGPEAAARWTEEHRNFFPPFQTMACFPIMDDQVVYGVLVLVHRQSREYSPEQTALIETITLEIGGTIRNSRLYAESKKRIAELSVLYEVGRAVSSTIELDKVLDTVVNITAKVLMAEGCALNVVDAQSQKTLVAAQYGHVPDGCRFRFLLDDPTQKAPAEVLACVGRNKPYVGPANQDPDCVGMREEGGDKSLICLPLGFKGAFKGVLSVYNKVTMPYGPSREFYREDLELLATMGTMISSSLENALIFKSVDELAHNNELLVRNLSCLYDISSAMMTTVKLEELLSIITNALTLGQALSYDRALIVLRDDKEPDTLMGAATREVTPEYRDENGRRLSELLRQGPLKAAPQAAWEKEAMGLRLQWEQGQGILARTAREKKSFKISSRERPALHDPYLPDQFGRRSFVTMPILAKGKIMGVIAVDRDFSEKDITDDDMQNLSLLANQAGLAIENSLLYEYIEHANTELSATRERLIEAEKLAALGEMAAGMAHEIRNPLVSIGGFTRRLLKNMEEDSPQRVYIEVIINEVTRLEKTLSDILEFSSSTLGQLEERNINDIVSEALYVLRREFEDGYIEVVKDLLEVPPVMVDERQIQHVLFNLFYNACQAMEHGGGLRVKTYPTRVSDRAFVAIEVSDTGKGIAPEVLPNIFNPFFTTKDAGTGLGLSIVHKIVTRHHGEIDVVNRAGEGATFIVKLPVSAKAGRYLK